VDADFFFRAAEHRRASTQQLIDIEGPHFILPSPCKAQQLFGQVGRASYALLDGIDMLHIRVGRIETNRQEGGPALDAHQQVIEIVGNSTGQSSDSLHFLRFEKFLFESFPFGEQIIDLVLDQFDGLEKNIKRILLGDFNRRINPFFVPLDAADIG
jgi:hypothetical protein